VIIVSEKLPCFRSPVPRQWQRSLPCRGGKIGWRETVIVIVGLPQASAKQPLLRGHAGRLRRSHPRRLFAALGKPLPEKNQVARVFFPMRARFHPPQQSRRGAQVSASPQVSVLTF